MVIMPSPLDLAAEAIAKQIAEAMVLIEERHRLDIKHARRIELEQVLVMMTEIRKIQASEVLLNALEQKIQERMERIYNSMEVL